MPILLSNFSTIQASPHPQFATAGFVPPPAYDEEIYVKQTPPYIENAIHISRVTTYPSAPPSPPYIPPYFNPL